VGFGPTIGAELGGYRLEALIGRGGMSAVYRAEDVRLHRTVALKFLAAELAADRRFRECFLTESRLAASIEHPSIVPIYEAGEAGGLLYIAMRYIDGGDLRELLRREGRLAPERAVGLVSQLAEALDAAHGAGLVHRDVKPSNVLIAVEAGAENAYLADFGLTRLTTTHGGPTQSDKLVGTVDYVAPEQIRGEDADGRADLYSLGCVLFECLVGEPPYRRRTEVAVIYAHLEDEPPRASERAPTVPPPLDDAIVGALAKDPNRRWQSGGELAMAARAGLRHAARPRRGPRALRRPRATLVAAGAGAALTISAAALLLTHSRDSGSRTAIAANAIAALDPATGSVTAQVPAVGSPAQMAAGEGAIWVTSADGHTVTRIDPASHTVRDTIPVGSGAGAIAVGEHGVWVVNSLGGTLTWISPATNEPVKTIPLGNGPSGVCAGGGAVWVANADDRTIWRIDPETGDRTDSIAIEHRPTALTCGGGAVWASSESSGTLTEIGASSRQVMRTIEVGDGANALAFSGGTLWVANPLDGAVSEIDPLRNVVAGTVRLGARAGPVAIAADDRGAWISNEFAGTVVRVDRSTGLIVQTRWLGNRPQGIAVFRGEPWVGVRASGARHRGGTLRILSELKFSGVGIDPAVAGGGVLSAQTINITNDGLMAFHRVGGRPGLELVPDLARSPPIVRDAGRMYTFRVRHGIRYSTGVLVRASDIGRGLERTLRAGSAGAGHFYTGIVGARACYRGPARCDPSRGIAADDAAATITFHLTEADPDFLYKLALPGAVAVPPGVETYPAQRPLPATGPYVIAGIEPRRFIRLVRNPRFRVWSNAAKPDGNPDAMTVRLGANQADAVRAVERGDADFVFGEVQHEPPEVLEPLFTRYAGQVHTNSQAATRYLFLNTHVPPFDDVRVRRALNYAVDRRAAIALEGGPRASQATCQILPPNFPGYARYCPYTAHAAHGQPWSAPDLRTARRLIARSGTRGMRVDVWGPDPEMAEQARFAVRLLDKLGYRARLRLVPFTRYWKYIGDSRNRAQIGPIWWGSDYPSPWDYLGQLFGCRSFTRDDPSNINWSEFCDREADRLMDRARRMQATDATAADAVWAQAEQRIVDRAAALPLDNPKLVDVLSRRVGNYQFSPQWGVLLDQLWVR
jgi:peptide/nickel transport system substrate-binding protein